MRYLFIEFGVIRISAQHHLRQALSGRPCDYADIDVYRGIKPETNPGLSRRDAIKRIEPDDKQSESDQKKQANQISVQIFCPVVVYVDQPIMWFAGSKYET